MLGVLEVGEVGSYIICRVMKSNTFLEGFLEKTLYLGERDNAKHFSDVCKKNSFRCS